MEYTNSALYHRCLKGQSLFSEANALSVRAEESLLPSAHQWDLQKTSKPMSPALDYISAKLSEAGLSIHLIISDQQPFVIPVWQLPYKSQTTLCKIVRKACQNFDLAPSWITALGPLSKQDLPSIFEAFKPDMYIVRRSILQREIVYSSEGLTLLSIDHVFTLKQLLRTLSKKEWISSSRYSCLDSCVQLLNRIQSICNGKPVTAIYIKRVYQEIPLQNTILNEVIEEYNARYCTQSCAQTARGYETWVSPLEKETDMVRTWAAIPLGPTPANHNNNDESPSPSSVNYPAVKKLSRPPPPSIISPINSTHQTFLPPPPSSFPPTRQLPPTPPRPILRISVPSSSKTASTSPNGSKYSDTSPAPLRTSTNNSPQSITKLIAFPSPPGYPAKCVPLIPSPVDSDMESSAGKELSSWDMNMLESPRTYLDSPETKVDSPSALPEVALCQRCHEIVVLKGLVGKGF